MLLFLIPNYYTRVFLTEEKSESVFCLLGCVATPEKYELLSVFFNDSPLLTREGNYNECIALSLRNVN